MLKSSNSILISALVIFASGCTSNSISNIEGNQQSNAKFYTDPNGDFIIEIPSELPRWTSFSMGFDSPESYPSFTTSNDSESQIRMTIFSTQEKCLPSVTGSSDLDRSTNIAWGRVDAWRNADQPPADTSYLERGSILCRPEGTPKPESAYVLCSEKNEKTVLICIIQQTDDQDLAKQVFSTFKWLE